MTKVPTTQVSQLHGLEQIPDAFIRVQIRRVGRQLLKMNRRGTAVGQKGIVYEECNLFYGNGITAIGAINGGAHDVIGDPRFVNAAADNYHLAPDSAAKDAGINAGVWSDLDGHARPFGPGFDIGAYEYTIYSIFLPVVVK